MQRRAYPGLREGAFVAPPALTTVRARTLFTPLDTGGRADTVTRRLAKAIRLGLLLDGERLPAESQLAGQLGVSTVTLREALATLRTMGLVETRRGRGGGSFVRAPDDPGRLERPLRLLSLHELRDIGDHRAAIAGTAARLAAERALPAGAPTRGSTSRSPRPPSRPGSPARRWTCGPRSATWSGCRWRARTWRPRP